MSRKEKFEKRKRQLWVYLLDYFVDWGFMPLLKEIADEAFDGTKLTREGARYILKGLQKEGKIEILKKKKRGIVLRGGGNNK